MRSTWIVNASGGVMLAVLVGQSSAIQQQPADRPGGDWPMYRGNYAGTGYSPLTQIIVRTCRDSLESDLWPARGRALRRLKRAAPGG